MRGRGLEPLALAIWDRDPVVANLQEVLTGMINPEKGLATVEDVMLGVGHIWAERIAENVELRSEARRLLWETGKVRTIRSEKLPADKGQEYKDYFAFSESTRRIPPHRILAINRGEKENVLKTRLEFDAEQVRRMAAVVVNFGDHPQRELLHKAVEDALDRLLLPSLEREIRHELTEEAEEHAVRIFARNLKSLLMQPPLRGRRILAIDPGFRTGCKLAALSECGDPLGHGVAYLIGKGEKKKHREEKPATPDAAAPGSTPVPDAGAAPPPPTEPAVPVEPTAAGAPASAETVQPAHPPSETASATSGEVVEQVAKSPESAAPVETIAAPEAAAAPPTDAPPTAPAPVETPPREAPSSAAVRAEAKSRMAEMIRKHNLELIAIGNGTACRETEEMAAELIAEQFNDLAYVIVNEAGASVYSASPVGREEFPDFDATLRGTISIGRRLQDPLSELVKIDPQNIGVGLYQQDIEPKRLKESLDAVIESCVNQVGVDLNTASVSLLRHVSGLNQLAARELVDFRAKHGPFKSRQQLLEVPGIGPARFTQAAGFLKIVGGDNPFDETWVHPESYTGVSALFGELGIQPDVLRSKDRLPELTERLHTIPKEETCAWLAIGMPTFQDICQALVRPGRDPREDLPPPIFKKGILKLDDLQPGMELKGTVLNVVDFGAFVDVGLKDSGLVHISQMSNRFIRKSVRSCCGGRHRDGLGFVSRSRAPARFLDDDQARHGAETAREEPAAATPAGGNGTGPWSRAAPGSISRTGTRTVSRAPARTTATRAEPPTGLDSGASSVAAAGTAAPTAQAPARHSQTEAFSGCAGRRGSLTDIRGTQGLLRGPASSGTA